MKKKRLYSILLVVSVFLISGCSLLPQTCTDTDHWSYVPMPVPYSIVLMDTCSGEVKEQILRKTWEFHYEVQKRQRKHSIESKNGSI